jgi:hypothetical protein
VITVAKDAERPVVRPIAFLIVLYDPDLRAPGAADVEETGSA